MYWLPGVILGQNCIQCSDTALDDLFFSKIHFIKSIVIAVAGLNVKNVLNLSVPFPVSCFKNTCYRLFFTLKVLWDYILFFSFRGAHILNYNLYYTPFTSLIIGLLMKLIIFCLVTPVVLSLILLKTSIILKNLPFWVYFLRPLHIYMLWCGNVYA